MKETEGNEFGTRTVSIEQTPKFPRSLASRREHPSRSIFRFVGVE
jgi:hypothetical protein